MTTRIDHTHCSHTATPRGRAMCRARRIEKICAAQKMYMDVAAAGAGYAEYEATVDMFAMDYGMNLRDAYTLIENGPVL